MISRRLSIGTVAGVVAATALIAIPAMAQRRSTATQHRYRLRATVGGEGYGQVRERGGVPSYQNLRLREGGTLHLSGFLWSRELLQGALTGEAFAVHELSPGNTGHGADVGLGGRFRLLPWSMFPLTLLASGRLQTLGAASLPGRELSLWTLGADWRLTPPKMIGLWLSARELHNTSAVQPAVATQLTGLSRGQQFQGINRYVQATARIGSKETNVRGSYRVAERIDSGTTRTAGLLPTLPTPRTQLNQTVRIDAAGTLSKKVDFAINGTGDIYNLGGAYTASEGRRFATLASARIHLDEEMAGDIAYGFTGDSRIGSEHHTLRANAHIRPDRNIAVDAGLRIEQQHSDAGVDRGREVMVLSGRDRGVSGPLAGLIGETVTLGGSQVDPGEAGMVLAHHFFADGRWRLTTTQRLSVSVGVSNSLDTSSLGRENHSYLVTGRWHGRFLDRLILDGLVTARIHELLDRRPGSTRERRGDVTTLLSARSAVLRNLRLGATVGSSLQQSMLDPSGGNSVYAQGDLMWIPWPTFSVSAFLRGRHSVTAGLSRDSAKLYSVTALLIRKFRIQVIYEYTLTDTQGSPGNNHLIRVTLSRVIDAIF